MINSEDLKLAIEQNSGIINRSSQSIPDWNDLYQNLNNYWRNTESSQLYWNILCLIAIETKGFIEFNPKVSFEVKLVINSESMYITSAYFSSGLSEIKTTLKAKGILPEIINKLDIRIS